jgi:hypothetical protein
MILLVFNWGSEGLVHLVRFISSLILNEHVGLTVIIYQFVSVIIGIITTYFTECRNPRWFLW